MKNYLQTLINTEYFSFYIKTQQVNVSCNLSRTYCLLLLVYVIILHTFLKRKEDQIQCDSRYDAYIMVIIYPYIMIDVIIHGLIIVTDLIYRIINLFRNTSIIFRKCIYVFLFCEGQIYYYQECLSDLYSKISYI